MYEVHTIFAQYEISGQNLHNFSIRPSQAIAHYKFFDDPSKI